MEWMIHNGFCHGLITGNAVGVHDVEAALYGTTLGMMADGSGTAGGHAVHMRAINEVKKAGSIQALVDSGRLKGGIMHALTVTGTPYVLAGSIRDDGPLPETIPSALDSQEAMRELTVKATMVVMVATALHAIAAGNMLPTFCVRPGRRDLGDHDDLRGPDGVRGQQAQGPRHPSGFRGGDQRAGLHAAGAVGADGAGVALIAPALAPRIRFVSLRKGGRPWKSSRSSTSPGKRSAWPSSRSPPPRRSRQSPWEWRTSGPMAGAG